MITVEVLIVILFLAFIAMGVAGLNVLLFLILLNMPSQKQSGHPMPMFLSAVDEKKTKDHNHHGYA